MFSLSEFYSAVEVRTAVAVVASPVALQVSNVLVHSPCDLEGHGVQGWVQRVGHLMCTHKELAVTLLHQQRCNNGVGGDGEVAGDEHPGS